MNALSNWRCAALKNRIIVSVNAGGYERFEKPVDLFFDFTKSLRQNLDNAPLTFQIIETDAHGSLSDSQVVWQFTPVNPQFPLAQAHDRLTFLLKGITQPHQTRTFEIYFDAGSPAPSANPASRLVSLKDDVMDEEQTCFQIDTPIGVYYYQKTAAGFSSIVDRDGSDWIGYHPAGGSAGHYRGIPNLAPYGFHPGYDNSNSWLIDQGELRVTIFSQNKNQEAACLWDIFPAYASMTVLSIGERPYWFLYEGTPGGKFDPENDYIVHADGRRRSAAESWDEALPEPEWLYFGSGKTPRVLYLIHHERDEHTDSYWQMEGNMTVFGFGRAPKGMPLTQYMRAAPAHFTIGFVEENKLEVVTQAINSAYRDLDITIRSHDQQSGTL